MALTVSYKPTFDKTFTPSKILIETLIQPYKWRRPVSRLKRTLNLDGTCSIVEKWREMKSRMIFDARGTTIDAPVTSWEENPPLVHCGETCNCRREETLHQLQTRAELRYDTHFALLLCLLTSFFFFPLNQYIVISIRTAHTNFFQRISEFRN